MLMLYSSSFAHIFMIAIEEEANLCEVREWVHKRVRRIDWSAHYTSTKQNARMKRCRERDEGNIASHLTECE